MARMRSILWVGGSEGRDLGAVADAPELEIAWVRDAEEARALPLRAFEALVVDAGDRERAATALRELRHEPALPPVVVRLARAAPEDDRVLCAAGARLVLRSDGDPRGPLPALREALAALERPPPAPDAPRGPPAREADAALVTASPAMQAVLRLARRATTSSATVLLSGETGTGKELLARYIHRGSPRAGHPFVAVNCAAFPETLLESELFGYEEGAFTGADRDKQGLIELADRGTLFLDEVAEMAPAVQAKLLRVLQEREIRPVGGSRSRRVDVRVVAATNRSLPEDVASGRFRQDLYYRLAVFPLTLPPLRERPEDLMALAERFLERHGRRDRKRGCRLSGEARDLLLSHAWPGNVRELENEIQRAVALAEPGAVIGPELLSERLGAVLAPVASVARPGETLRETLARVEAWLIRRALDRHDGRRAVTARALGITREGLWKKMQRHRIR